MRLSTLLGASVLSIAVPLLAVAEHGHGPSRRHHDVALAARGNLEKRVDNARFTYYDITTGQVACEGYYSASDFVVALNSDQYGGYWKSDNCFKEITISYGGKTTQAKIVDECPGCPYGGLDMTQGLFEYFASTDKGVLYGEWSFGSGGSGGGGGGGGGGGDPDPTTTSKKPKPKPTTSKKAEPTTTWTPPDPTTWWQPETTTTSTKKTTSKKHTTSTTSTTPTPTSTKHSTTSKTPTTSSAPSTSSTISTTSSTPTTSAAATPSLNLAGAAAGLAALPTDTVEVSDAHPHNLNQANWALVNLGSLVESAN